MLDSYDTCIFNPIPHAFTVHIDHTYTHHVGTNSCCHFFPPPDSLIDWERMYSLKLPLLVTVVLSCSILTVEAGGQRWMDSPANRLRAENKTAHKPKEYVVNLDLPQYERWQEIGKLYADKSFLLVEYLRRNLPPGWLKPIEALAAKLMPFFRDYGDEMKGYAAALGIKEGDVVAINLIYQLERLGLSCDSWNNTGPSMACELPRNNDDESPDSLVGYGPFMPFPDSEEDEYAREMEHIDAPGPCTSFVVSDPDGKVWAGRNLDWNFPGNSITSHSSLLRTASALSS